MKKYQTLLLSLALQASFPLSTLHASSDQLLEAKENNSLSHTPIICSDAQSVLDPSGRYYTSPDDSWSLITPFRWAVKKALILGEKALVTTLSKGNTISAQIKAKIWSGPTEATLVHVDGIYQVGDLPYDLLLAHRELRAPCSLAAI